MSPASVRFVQSQTRIRFVRARFQVRTPGGATQTAECVVDARTGQAPMVAFSEPGDKRFSLAQAERAPQGAGAQAGSAS